MALSDGLRSCASKLLTSSDSLLSKPASPLSFSLLLRRHKAGHRHKDQYYWSPTIFTSRERSTGRRVKNSGGLRVLAAESSSGRQRRAPPGVDTRIHWENEEEGWVGGSSSTNSQPSKEDHEEDQRRKSALGEKFSDLLNTSSDSHYQFLGISVEADLEEIKAAYRRLSKEYHPDTTSLPLKAASEKFMKLREVYDVLSNEESRRFYDWTLAQEAASREAEKMKMKLEDPYMQEVDNWVSVPDMVDRLGGKNMELSDQAVSALTFDVLIIVFSICCIIYVLVFKEPYYY